MKTSAKLIFFTGLSLIAFNTVQANQICIPPIIKTLHIPKQDITSHSTILRGEIIARDHSVLQYYFQWGPPFDSFSISTRKHISIGHIDKKHIVKINLTGLGHSHPYDYRLAVKDKCSGKTIYGGGKTFKTKKR